MAKILIVDDDHNLANLTKTALVTKGFQVAVVHESLRVIEEIKKYRPDLILMDIMMPKLSGGDLVKLLKNDPDLRNIPVIFLTGLISGEESIATEGINIEGNKYPSLGKPYEIDHLLKVMERILSKVGR